MTIVTEADMLEIMRALFASDPLYAKAEQVTGPGRSGAMAALHASYMLNIDHLPAGRLPLKAGPVLIIDIVASTTSGLHRLAKRYRDHDCIELLLIECAPGERPHLWFQHTPIKPNVRTFTREPAREQA